MQGMFEQQIKILYELKGQIQARDNCENPISLWQWAKKLKAQSQRNNYILPIWRHSESKENKYWRQIKGVKSA